MSEKTLRVVAVDDSVNPDSLNDFCKSRCESYLISKQEIGSVNKTPHYHLWFKSKLKSQAFRKQFKDTFKTCIGNKGYSLASIKKTTLKAQEYTIKSGTSYASEEFTPKMLEEIQAGWKSQKEFSNMNSKQMKHRTLKMYESLERLYYEGKFESNFYTIRREWYKLVLTWYREQDKVPPAKHLIQSWFSYCINMDTMLSDDSKVSAIYENII